MKNSHYEFFETSNPFDALTQLREHFGYHRMNVDEQDFYYAEKVYRFGCFHLIEINMHGSVEIKHYEKDGFYSFNFPIDGHLLVETKEQTIKVNAGEVFILSSTEMPNFKRPEGRKALVLSVLKEDLMSALIRILGYHPEEMLSFPITGFAQRSVSCVVEALSNIMNNLEMREDESMRKMYVHDAEAYLQTLLLTRFENSVHTLLKSAGNQEFPQVIKRVITYMHEHIAQKITLFALSQVAEISARSLTYQFKKHTGRSPLAYLLGLRLKRLREALKASDPNASILEIAIELGLNHAGRLAGQYKKHFGELPSDTLKR